MKILFIEAVATPSESYKAGSTHDLPDEFAQQLIKAKVAKPAIDIADNQPAVVRMVKGRSKKQITADEKPGERI